MEGKTVMKKKTYVTPVADLLRFDYRETVVATSGYDASHCTFNRQPGGCGPSNYGQCKKYFTDSPGECNNNN